jgi:acyl-CoA thioester hydrolase
MCNVIIKRSLRYGEKMIVEAQYEPCEAAKLKFKYHLYNADANQLVATGSSVQVFLDRNTHLLQLTNPDFFEKWKTKNECYRQNPSVKIFKKFYHIYV